MGVLGKDLLDFYRPRTNTKVEFGASGYWVESHPTMQPYGTALTEILNLDAAPLQELLDQCRNAVAEKDSEQAARAFQAMANGFASLPLYRLYWEDIQLFASMDARELFVGEAQEAFREYVMQDDTLPRFMQEQLDAIRLIQDRYVWFQMCIRDSIRIAALLGRDDPALAAHQLEAFVPLLRAFAARHAVHRVVALLQLDAGEAVEIRAVRLDPGLRKPRIVAADIVRREHGTQRALFAAGPFVVAVERAVEIPDRVVLVLSLIHIYAVRLR